MKVVYSPRYAVDIGAHVFSTRKYQLVHARLLESGSLASSDVIEPTPAEWEQLALIHTTEYLAKMRAGDMSPDDLAELELPWSSTLVDAFRTMVGGTVLAANIACGQDPQSECGVARERALAAPERQTPGFRIVSHIGGGLHHAFPNHGEGFCPFNDVAVAIRVLQRRGLSRAAVVDLDVHHGNGTAFIFESDPTVFTFSMHQQYNYPAWKPKGSLDIGLPDGTGDDEFLRRIEGALPRVFAAAPQCIFYLAGADPYADDQLGGLSLTRAGLRTRDRMVFQAARRADLPVVVTLAGGYARNIADTVAIHVATIEEALRATTIANGR